MNPNQQLTPQQSASFQSTIGNIQNNINTYASSQNKQLVQNPGGSYSTSSSQNIPGSSYINNTPINTTPDASTVAGANPTPIYVPPQSSQQISNSASSAINNVNVLNGNYGQNLTNNQGALLNTTDSNTQKNQQSYNDQAGYVQSLITQYAGMGQDQLNQEQQAGVPKLQTQSNQLTQQYLASQATYNSQYNDILNNPNLTREQASAQIDSLQQQHGFNLTDIGIRQSIAQNDYNNAETLIQHQIQIKYGALANQISYQQQFLQNNKDLLTQSEQQSFQANLQVQQQMYTQGTYYSQLNAQTSMDLLKDATANGAPQQIISEMSKVIASGGSAADVAQVAGQYTVKGNFSPVQTGYDQSTGLPIYSGFNQNTGQMQVKNPGNLLGTTGSQDTVMSVDGTGYQMGATTTMGAYASATDTQVKNATTTIAKINANVGTIIDSSTAQKAIDTIAKNSPITGTMIMNASQQYGIKPAALIAVMQAETQLGTDKSKGSQMNNFGNVGNTDSAMAAGQPTGYKSAQAGVDAVAENLAKRQVGVGQVDPAQPNLANANQPSNIQDSYGGVFSNAAAQKVGSLPQAFQKYAIAGPLGVAYINIDAVPSSQKDAIQFSAATNGVKAVSASDASMLQSIDTVYQSIGSMQTLIDNNLIKAGKNPTTGYINPINSVAAKVGNVAKSTLNTFTGTYPDLTNLSNFKNTAIKSVQALAGGAGSGLRINQGEIQAQLDNLPSTTDTFETAQAKLGQVKTFLNQKLSSIFPYVSSANAPQQTTNNDPLGILK